MKTHNLKINQLAPEVYQWYLSYLEAIDNKNIEAYTNFLADDCVILSNNTIPSPNLRTGGESTSKIRANFTKIQNRK
ncbi:MAG: hypothetical protein KME29_06910 [Calothrix sp. FI2-JRJ7]|jgi:ketosteroid isomerase-like protein|nr:hypothetical protein [Calothrix sp. FI2-JRJ7]